MHAFDWKTLVFLGTAAAGHGGTDATRLARRLRRKAIANGAPNKMAHGFPSRHAVAKWRAKSRKLAHMRVVHYFLKSAFALPGFQHSIVNLNGLKYCDRCGFHDELMRKCGRCRRRRYCSKTCQKRDWTHGHRADCVAR